jgi:hypothetical protein
VKVKKYQRGESADLEVPPESHTINNHIAFSFFFLHFNLNITPFWQALKDKKLKGQLANREELYKRSANAAAKAEKVRLYCCILLLVLLIVYVLVCMY